MKLYKFSIFLFLIFICQEIFSNTYYGYASWYGVPFHGRKTASGETFNMNNLTAAHKTLPFGTYVKVTNIHNNKSIVLKINDRGPFKPNRIIDVSKHAAEKLGFIQKGLARVKLDIVDKPKSSVRTYLPNNISEETIDNLIPVQSSSSNSTYKNYKNAYKRIPNYSENSKISENNERDIDYPSIREDSLDKEIPKITNVPDIHLKNNIKEENHMNYVELNNPKKNTSSKKNRRLTEYNFKNFPSYQEPSSELNQYENNPNYYNKDYHNNPKTYLGEIIDVGQNQNNTSQKASYNPNYDTNKDTNKDIYSDSKNLNDPNYIREKFEEGKEKIKDNTNSDTINLKIYSKKENQFYKFDSSGSVFKVYPKRGYRIQFGAYSQLNTALNYRKNLKKLNIPTEIHMIIGNNKLSFFKLVTKKVFQDHTKATYVKNSLNKEKIDSFIISY